VGAFGRYTLAAAAQTGNNTHTAVELPESARSVTLEFTVSAIGATPTVTYALQGSFDGITWDTTGISLIPANSDTGAATRTVTTVATFHQSISQRQSRSWRWHRLVTTANTNVTYGPCYLYFDVEDNE
jgi:hypothetical protein